MRNLRNKWVFSQENTHLLDLDPGGLGHGLEDDLVVLDVEEGHTRDMSQLGPKLRVLCCDDE